LSDFARRVCGLHHYIIALRDEDGMGLWLAIGIAIGVAIGAMYDNVAIGIGIGVVLGIAFASIERTRR
jgi:hypothetical protein